MDEPCLRSGVLMMICRNWACGSLTQLHMRITSTGAREGTVSVPPCSR